VIADTGEDAIVYCPTSDYAANIELAEAVAPGRRACAPTQAMTKTPTPGKSTCADVAALLGLPLQQTVKSLVLATDETDAQGDIVVKSTVWLLLVRGDHDLNEIKAGKLPGLKAAGALPRGRDRGPLRLQARLPGADRPEEAGQGGGRPHRGGHAADFVCGANEADFHFTGVNWGRDLPEPDLVADIRNVVAGDRRPTARACWPSSAASRWAMCSTWAPSTARR
jgi:prolyl-tRNA synthetase